MTPPRKVQIVRVAHVYYKHKDHAKAETFLADFGLVEENRTTDRVYYRGYGPEPFVYCLEKADKDEFGGAAVAVATREDLELARDTIDGASEIYELKDAPGGGFCVTFSDPVDGYPFHLVWGQQMREVDKVFQYLEFNYVGRSYGDSAVTMFGTDGEASRKRRRAKSTNSNALKRVTTLGLDRNLLQS